ncbi:MAG: S9 family peptidase, partial [Duncaniella sp.]|nr:S9 family peptidase [Duncaniella sp.]
MKSVQILATAMLTCTLAGCHTSERINYPAAPQDGTTDTIFGMEVPDIYRPLENDTAPATLAWVEAENKVTQEYLSKIPYRKAIGERLTQLANYAKRGLPHRGPDGKYYFSENDGLQNQYVIYRSTTPDGKEREVFLDPNKLSEDGTVALGGYYHSKDGKYTAYTINRSGSDWVEIYVMDTATGELLDDHIEWAKFSGATWDGDGFYYSAYPRPEAGKEFSNANENHNVYYHKIGTPQSEDTIVFSDPANPLHFHGAELAETDPTLFVTIGGQGVGNALKMRRNGAWVTVSPDQEYAADVIDVINGKVYLLTNYGADRKRIVTADVANPGRENWQELVGQLEDGVITGAGMAGEDMYVQYQKDATDHVAIYDLKGNKKKEIELPILGSVGLSTSQKYPDEVFYSIGSFTSPN